MVVFVDFQGGRQLWLSGLVSVRKRKWQVKCRSGGMSSLPAKKVVFRATRRPVLMLV